MHNLTKWLGALTIVGFGQAAQARPFTVKEVNFRTEYLHNNREPMRPQAPADASHAGVAFEVNVDILDKGYWNNRVHTEAVDATVKTVGWEFEKGFRLNQYFDIYWYHHSQHVMDEEQPRYLDNQGRFRQTQFPLKDAIGIRFKLLGD